MMPLAAPRIVREILNEPLLQICSFFRDKSGLTIIRNLRETLH
jgi:hypothetical protein